MVETKQQYLTIHTKRLYLRRVNDADWQDLYNCICDPDVTRYEPHLADEQRHQWVDNCIASDTFWAICLAETGEMIGNVYLGKGEQDNWEIGYMLSAQYQKQGYATEALGPLICRAFHIEGAHRVYAFCNPENAASWKLLERLGFRREGLIKQNVYFHQDVNGEPIWQDTLIYGVLREEWLVVHVQPKRALL